MINNFLYDLWFYPLKTKVTPPRKAIYMAIEGATWRLLKVQYSQKETPGLNLVFNQFGQILAKFTCKPNATRFANWL